MDAIFASQLVVKFLVTTARVRLEPSNTGTVADNELVAQYHMRQ
jgi:hypothetical protein